jgi:hypothetical protein
MTYGFDNGAITAIGGNLLAETIYYTNTPTNPNELATKAYVDSVAQGLTIQAACFAGSIASLTVTYNNGTAGVGATLTNAGTQATFSIDGTTPGTTQRILIKDQISQFQNGIYTVTNVGSGATNWVLTRATDYDTPAEINPGDLVIVNNGTVNTNTSWLQTSNVTTIGTDPITFTQFTANPATFLKVANNLSDVADAPTSATNLGLGTGDSPTFAGMTITGTATAGVAFSSNKFSLTGSSTGIISILPQAAAGTYNFNLPITPGSAGDILTSGGGGESPMTWTPVSTGFVTSITGTANEVLANGLSGSAQTGAVTLTTPQAIGTASSPTFASLTLSSPLTGANGGTGVANTGLTINLAAGAVGKYLASDSSGNGAWATLSGSTVTTLTGTANQVLVNGTSGTPTSGPITLTLPQSIATNSSVTFGGVTSGIYAALTNSATTSATSTTPGFYIQNSNTTTNNWMVFEFVLPSANPGAIIGAQITNQSTNLVDLVLFGRNNSTGVVEGLRLVGATNTIVLANPLPAASGGTANAFTAFTGPATSVKTFTLPNASSTILTDNAPVTPAQGGTGETTYVIGDLLVASSSTVLNRLAAVATGNALISTGIGSPPGWGKIDLTNTVTGILPLANGGTGTSTAFTQTAVIFAGSGGVYTQDPSFFAYDSGSHRLSIGTNAFLSAIALYVKGISGVVNSTMALDAPSSTAKASIQMLNAGAVKWELGKSVNAGADDFELFDTVAGSVCLTVTTGGNFTIGTNTSSQLSLNAVTSATASIGGIIPPVMVQGFIDVIINGTHRKIPYYAN